MNSYSFSLFLSWQKITISSTHPITKRIGKVTSTRNRRSVDCVNPRRVRSAWSWSCHVMSWSCHVTWKGPTTFHRHDAPIYPFCDNSKKKSCHAYQITVSISITHTHTHDRSVGRSIDRSIGTRQESNHSSSIAIVSPSPSCLYSDTLLLFVYFVDLTWHDIAVSPCLGWLPYLPSNTLQ